MAVQIFHSNHFVLVPGPNPHWPPIPYAPACAVFLSLTPPRCPCLFSPTPFYPSLSCNPDPSCTPIRQAPHCFSCRKISVCLLLAASIPLGNPPSPPLAPASSHSSFCKTFALAASCDFIHAHLLFTNFVHKHAAHQPTRYNTITQEVDKGR